jgi:hypothetical protein
MPRRTCALTMILLALLIAATTDAGACCVQRAFVSSHGNYTNQFDRLPAVTPSTR